MTDVKNQAKKMFSRAIYASAGQNGFLELVNRLKKVVPDVSEQYTTFEVNDVFLETMVRCLHGFQMSLVERAVNLIDKEELTVVDIGDSSGAHLRYLQSGEVGGNQKIDAMSVNLDPIAVEKIRQKGLPAIECRAENVHRHPDFKGREVDLFLSFETLEHLLDPISFLHALADSDYSNDPVFVITVPYLARSRVALHQLRRGEKGEMFAENTHIFELCPDDWRHIFRFAGWEVIEDRVYRMYPRWSPYYLFKFLWKRFSFDGYYGCILRRNTSISERYKSW